MEGWDLNSKQSTSKDHISATVENRKDLKPSETIIPQNSTHWSSFVYSQPPFISIVIWVLSKGVCLDKLQIFTTWTCDKKQWVSFLKPEVLGRLVPGWQSRFSSLLSAHGSSVQGAPPCPLVSFLSSPARDHRRVGLSCTPLWVSEFEVI